MSPVIEDLKKGDYVVLTKGKPIKFGEKDMINKIEQIKKIILERIEHPIYPSMDFNKMNKKKVTMEVEDILEERKEILLEILNQIEDLE